MLRIDAHQHYWRIAERRGHWPPAQLARIHRDFLPEDLRPSLQAAQIAGTVLVQSLPSDADTGFLLELAGRSASVLGVVGWIDMKAGSAAAGIAALAAQPKLRGLRPMLQDLSDDDWIADPALAPAAEAMTAHRLVFDALVLPRQLPALAVFAQRHPGLAIVIDHGAKPPIASRQTDAWQRDMARLAALPNVHCKLSGLLTEAGADRSRQALQPYVDVLWQLFGAPRLLWGSDWPVLCLAGDYAGWLDVSQALLDALRPAATLVDREAIFGANAQRIYRLELPTQ